jgi:hypothetical protein
MMKKKILKPWEEKATFMFDDYSDHNVYDLQEGAVACGGQRIHTNTAQEYLIYQNVPWSIHNWVALL